MRERAREGTQKVRRDGSALPVRTLQGGEAESLSGLPDFPAFLKLSIVKMVKEKC